MNEQDRSHYTIENASTLCAQYESITFDEVHGHWLCHLPRIPSTVADIGAGSGRDAAALAKRGFEVYAVEPSPAMLSLAEKLHTDNRIVWIRDALPKLMSLSRRQLRFDLLLLSAVWMHLSREQRTEAMANLSQLANPGCVAVITLRHPADPARDMFDVSPEETTSLAASAGFDCLSSEIHPDALHRSDVNWSFVILKKQIY